MTVTEAVAKAKELFGIEPSAAYKGIETADAPYAAWLSDVLATLEEHKVTKIAVAAPLPGGEVFTGYFAMGTMDKALMATNIQADATMDAICANGPLIQQAWEDAEENEDDPEEEV